MPTGFRFPSSRRALRYRLTLLLHACDRPLSVTELVAHLEAIGWPAPPPAHKTVSDSLRWEVGHGRVRRVGRGRYTRGVLDRRTAWWMQRQLDQWESVARVSESRAEHTLAAQQASDPLPDWLAALRPHVNTDVARVSE